MMTLALTIGAQAQTKTIDTAQFVAVYDYECTTQDAEGQGVTDKMQVVVQVGRTVMKSMPRSVYRQRDESEEADEDDGADTLVYEVSSEGEAVGDAEAFETKEEV